MHKPSENPSFASKQAATEYVRDTILNALQEDVEGSRLSIGVHDSPKTNSKYINLYYPDRADNPDPDRVPFTVRISDHAQQPLFRQNRPNAFFQIVPKMSPAVARRRQRKIALYDHLSVALQTDLTQSTRKEVANLRAQVARNLNAEQKAFHYTYKNDLLGTIDQMRKLIDKLPSPSDVKPLIAMSVEARMKLKMIT